MTVITVNAPVGRLSVEQSRTLALTLTDAVLVPEVGQMASDARVGFQVLFRDYETDHMAIGGVLIADLPQPADVVVIDVAVMDANWQQDVRTEVIARVLNAMADACGLAEPSPSWWVNFRVIDEGSWGAGAGVLSILALLDSGVFTPERANSVRQALNAD